MPLSTREQTVHVILAPSCFSHESWSIKQCTSLLLEWKSGQCLFMGSNYWGREDMSRLDQEKWTTRGSNVPVTWDIPCNQWHCIILIKKIPKEWTRKQFWVITGKMFIVMKLIKYKGQNTSCDRSDQICTMDTTSYQSLT